MEGEAFNSIMRRRRGEVAIPMAPAAKT